MQIQVVFRNSWTSLTYVGNIDEALLAFLKLYFPKEVKAKQIENERLAGLDQLEKIGFGPRQKGERREDCIIS
jgi:hypothetical protein